MKPGRIYRITHQCFDPTDDIQEIVDISDTDYLIDDGDDAEVIDLDPGPNPVSIQVVDNDEDPLTVVKGQKLTMEVLTDNPISMNTFASGSDQRWLVHNYIGGKTIFKGNLVLDDLSEDFMPEPNTLVLTAGDGLGLLGDVPLTDFEGNNPVGEYKIIELLAMALSKTGLELGIKAAFNIKNSGSIDDISIPNANNQHFFSLNYLNAKTFEDEIGTCISCREVIERILGEEAFIVQRQGYWWIVRVDEIEHPSRGLYITEWDHEGTFVGNLGEKTFEKDIAKDDPYTICFSKEATKVSPTRPIKAAKLTYEYNYPNEIVDNIDFERGEVIDDSSPTTKTYTVEDWPAFNSAALADEIPTTDIYVRKIFEDGYQKDKYLVIEASPDFNFVMSNPIRMNQRDRFRLSVQRRLSSDISGSGLVRERHVQVRLYGVDGTFWTLKTKTSASNERRWVQCTSSFRTNQQHLAIENELANDLTEAIDVYDGESAELPVNGSIRILLYASSEYGDTVATYFSGLTLDYIPFVNGSHNVYNSQHQEVTQAGNFKARRDVTVAVSDGVRAPFKGALLKGLQFVPVFSGSVTFTPSNSFKIAGYQLAHLWKGQRLNISGTTSNNIAETRVASVEYFIIPDETIITIEATTTTETDASTLVQELTFELSDEFYNAAVYPDGPPDSTYVHPYSEIQVYDVFNQFNYDKRVFQGTIQGLDLSALDGDLERNNAHLVHKWSLRDAHESTTNKFFQLLTFDHNHRLSEGTGVWREVYDITREKVYTGRVFKYNV